MITMKNIIREGHPTLEKKSDPVSLPLDEETKQTLKEMREFLINSQDEEKREEYELREGVGLSAPQIDLPKRLIAIYTLDEKFETLHDYLMVNPKIISHSEAKTYMPGGEGCLSVDREVEGLVPRHKKVTVKTLLYNPESGTVEEARLRLRGFLSIVFQHELDHLNGVLFTKRVEESLEGISPVQFQPPQDNNQNNESHKEAEL